VLPRFVPKCSMTIVLLLRIGQTVQGRVSPPPPVQTAGGPGGERRMVKIYTIKVRREKKAT
jgi:hypothetical protein